MADNHQFARNCDVCGEVGSNRINGILSGFFGTIHASDVPRCYLSGWEFIILNIRESRCGAISESVGPWDGYLDGFDENKRMLEFVWKFAFCVANVSVK